MLRLQACAAMPFYMGIQSETVMLSQKEPLPTEPSVSPDFLCTFLIIFIQWFPSCSAFYRHVCVSGKPFYIWIIFIAFYIYKFYWAYHFTGAKTAMGNIRELE